jgi:hypothetical protein
LIWGEKKREGKRSILEWEKLLTKKWNKRMVDIRAHNIAPISFNAVKTTVPEKKKKKREKSNDQN